MVIPAKISSVNSPDLSSTTAMIHCGASKQFTDSELVRKLGLPLKKKSQPEKLLVVDGRETEAPLTHTCTLKLLIDQHLETIVFEVTKLAGWQLILGKT